MAVSGALFAVLHYFDNLNNDAGWTPDSTCFIYAFIVPILTALLCALFVGCEYSDGTMRNKIISGHRRGAIYLSNLIICSAAGIIMCLAYLAVHTCAGILLLGGFTMSGGKLIVNTALTFALVVAFAGLFVLIAMLCSGKAYSTAACLLLTFALLLVGIRITSALNEPEYFSGYSMTQDGVTIEEGETKNPNYVGGTKRQIYEFLNDLLPGGQVIKLAKAGADAPAKIALYDAAILLAATGCGLVIFRKKDLK